jgi:hypothetical protein
MQMDFEWRWRVQMGGGGGGVAAGAFVLYKPGIIKHKRHTTPHVAGF